MRNVTVDPVNQTLVVQGGALWADVDKAAGEHGLATVGGVVNHTGVGGLTLGGGYGWLTGQYGLVIDNLLAVKIALADGRILTASDTENSDLFWAIRGAGHNFGVVTEFTLQAYELKDPVYAGLLGFTPDKLEQVMEFASTLTENSLDGRSGIYCFLGTPPGASEQTIMTEIVSNTSEEEGKRRYAPLFDLNPVMNTVSMIPYHQVNGLLNDIASHGGRKSMKGFSYTSPVRPEFARTVLGELSYIVKCDPDMIKSFVVFENVQVDKVASIPRHATAFANRGHARNGGVWMWWSDPKNDDKARQHARYLKDLITEEIEKHAGWDVAIYPNFVETGDRSLEELFGDNLDRLKSIKAKYDPRNVFNKMHPLSGYSTNVQNGFIKTSNGNA
ncbi:hypothetical protein AWENTII_005259 [Aspergillus wentii]